MWRLVFAVRGQSSDMRKPRHPSMAGPSFKPLSQDSLGVSRLDGGAVGAAAVVTAARASHVRQGRSATVRAVHGRSSGGLPVRATRMRVGARGLVLRQCHCVSSVSFERLSLSVQYLNLCSVQTAKSKQNPNKNQAKSVLLAVYSLPSSWAFNPSKAAKRISVTS